MAYWVSSVVQGSMVGYPSDSLASYFYFLLFLMCHYAVKWCDKLRLPFAIGGPLKPSFYFGGFWIYWALSILQYPSQKKDYFFQRGPRPKKVTGGPGWLRYATDTITSTPASGPRCHVAESARQNSGSGVIFVLTVRLFPS